jgi:uncharacterized membrane protein YtjA (UPF0391 family)
MAHGKRSPATMARQMLTFASDIKLRRVFRALQSLLAAESQTTRRRAMLHWSLIFLIVALVAALFGFTGIYVAAASIAKILFFVFLVLFIISLFAGGVRRPLA